MKQFEYTLHTKMGIHARPAALIADRTKFLEEQISISFQGKTANAKSAPDIIGLGAKKGDTLTVTVEGPNEDHVAAEIEMLLKENL